MRKNILREVSAAHKEQFIAELPKCGGIITAALNNIGISAPRYYKWLKNDEEFRVKVEALLSEIRVKESMTLSPKIDKVQVKKWENDICETIQISESDLPLLRKRLEYLSEVTYIHNMWSARAKASDCSNATLASYCSISKVMAAALNDLDDAIDSIRSRSKKRSTSFSITVAPSTKKNNILKL